MQEVSTEVDDLPAYFATPAAQCDRRERAVARRTSAARDAALERWDEKVRRPARHSRSEAVAPARRCVGARGGAGPSSDNGAAPRAPRRRADAPRGVAGRR